MTQPKNPDPNVVFPNEYKTSVFLKNVVSAPNISVGDYTYYDSAEHPENFEKNASSFQLPCFRRQACHRQILSNRARHDFHHGRGKSSPLEHFHLSVQRDGKDLEQGDTGPLERIAAQGRHRDRQRRLARTRMRNHAGRHDRRRSHRCRILRCNQRRRTLQRRRRQSGALHQETFRRRTHLAFLQWKWWDLEGEKLFESLSILVNPDLGNVRLQIRALLAK